MYCIGDSTMCLYTAYSLVYVQHNVRYISSYSSFLYDRQAICLDIVTLS